MRNQFGNYGSQFFIQPEQTLTTQEIGNISFMLEEEKLAHDVYEALDDMWGSNIFDNIASSESNHVSSIQRLADKNGISTTTLPEGVFANSELQTLYNQLVEIGSQSIEDALKVGVSIEVLDIEDLTDEISITTNNDLLSTYSRLLSASERHLSAFTQILESTGDTLSADEVTTWLESEISLLDQSATIETPYADEVNICLAQEISLLGQTSTAIELEWGF